MVEDGSQPPRFAFGEHTAIGMLYVHRESQDQICKEKKKEDYPDILIDKQNMMWAIEGEHDSQSQITFGIVPHGMRETVAAKPLLEGEYSYVFTGSLVGQAFKIQNGKAEEVKCGR